MKLLCHGDCLDVMRSMPDCGIDAIVTDPPYGLNFMGKKWDCNVPSVQIWQECLRVLKPGGHLLAFAGTRTQHRMATAIEDAGFEIRDMIAWVYGSGFPKSMDVSKALDAQLRFGKSNSTALNKSEKERPVVGTVRRVVSSGRTSDQRDTFHGVRANRERWHNYSQADIPVTAPATEAAKQWQGWGTALKPALEPITLARKPLVGTVVSNVLKHGTGALNIDGCRVGDDVITINTWDDGSKPFGGGAGHPYTGRSVIGRWPANLVHDGSEEVLSGFPNETSRFFYCSKANKKERGTQNTHPTVKPVDLMRYLCRFITPPSGLVLDPFMGSGTTGVAALLEGFHFVGIEQSLEYIQIAQQRIDSYVEEQP